MKNIDDDVAIDGNCKSLMTAFSLMEKNGKGITGGAKLTCFQANW